MRHDRVVIVFEWICCVIMGSSTAVGQCLPSTGLWSPLTPMSELRAEISSVVINSEIYVFGSRHHNSTAWGPNNRASKYDPITDSWTILANMPTGRGLAAAATVNGKAFVICGNNCISSCWLTTNEMYDPATDSWQTMASLPGTARGLLSATAVGGKIYVMGGTNSFVVPTFSDNFIYDPQSNSWTTGAPLPRPRSHHTAEVIDGKIYLIGGRYRLMHNNPIQIPEVDVYDPVTNSWSQVSPMLTPRMQLTSAVHRGSILAIGGNEVFSDGSTSGGTTIVEEYNPVLDCWQRVTSLALPTDTTTAQQVNSQIYVIGGHGPSSPYDQVFVSYPLPEGSGIFADVDGDGDVDRTDLALVKALLPACAAADVNNDYAINVTDLLLLLGAWGVCP